MDHRALQEPWPVSMQRQIRVSGESEGQENSQTHVADLVFCYCFPSRTKLYYTLRISFQKNTTTHQKNLTYEYFLTLKRELNKRRKEAAVLPPLTLWLTLPLWHSCGICIILFQVHSCTFPYHRL